MAILQQILAVLTTLMSVILLIIQIKASEDFMSKAINGFKEWLDTSGLSQARIAEITGIPKATVAGWCTGTKVRDYPDMVKKLREGLKGGGYTEALQDFDNLIKNGPVPNPTKTSGISASEHARVKEQLALYSELEGLEDRIRQTAVARADHTNRLLTTGKGPATHKYDNSKHENVTMRSYQRMVEILEGEKRALLESSTLALTTNFFHFVELWERFLAGASDDTPESRPRESKTDALYDDIRVHRARLHALGQANDPKNLSREEIQGLIQGADVQLKGQFLWDRIARAEGPFESRPFHSEMPNQVARAYAEGLKHALESSFKHYSHFDQAKKRQALHLLHPRFHQAFSSRLRGQYDGHITHHNYVFRSWCQLVEEVEHELIGF